MLRSYISNEQFEKLFTSVTMVNNTLGNHSQEIDDLEHKMLEVSKKRRIRKEQKIKDLQENLQNELSYSK